MTLVGKVRSKLSVFIMFITVSIIISGRSMIAAVAALIPSIIIRLKNKKSS